MDEQRQVNRTEVDETTQLSITLHVEGSEDCQGELGNLSMEGAAARFPVEDCPQLSAGDSVELSFTSPDVDQAIRTAAVVKHLRTVDTWTKVGFNYVDKKHLRDQLDRKLLSVFNRRKMLRVRPDPNWPIEVTVQARETVLVGKIVNISETGMALALSDDRTYDFDTIDRMMLTFELPTSPEPVQLRASVRYLHDDGDEKRWGLEFDEENSVDFELHVEVIRKYVEMRRQEMLGQVDSIPGQAA